MNALSDILLKSFKKDEQEGQWAIVLNSKTVQTFQGCNRWTSKKLAKEALTWHCEYSIWATHDPDAGLVAPELISKAVNSLLKDGTVKIVKVKDSTAIL